ncbi:MAG TPA: hypothetical protein DCM07_27380, partial [Planctomycetaceae bacterium]|nr:hypothetical protein [Planctomycetaceae bacterium]
MILTPRWLRSPQPAAGKQILEQISQIAHSLVIVNDSELRTRCQNLRRLNPHLAADREEMTVRCFALTYESVRRVLDLTYFPEQLLAGLAMIRGEIVEMNTGEGKTITAVLPACWFALTGQSVHVMTVNDYLAERDFHSLSPVYGRLGFTTALNQPGLSVETKRSAYQADIIYGPGYEFGFDYLRDQVNLFSQKRHRLGSRFSSRLSGIPASDPQPVQREHAVAIVDEADSVLIDEATVPLVLSSQGGRPADNADVYQAARSTALSLKTDHDYVVNTATSELQMTDTGIARLAADVRQLPSTRLDRPWRQYVEQALRAELFYQREVHYIFRDKKVQIVDPHTSRIFTDRTWRDGLHQAIETKEAGTITNENRPIARIRRQKFFHLYNMLTGMSGTVQGCQQELSDIYRLSVCVIPPHKRCRRIDLPPRLFVDGDSREQAVVQSIQEIHSTQRPVLAGTSDIHTSKRLSRLLDQCHIAHQVLNGLQDESEAKLIASAGEPGTITIATNLAGRGTDIKLGAEAIQAGGLHVIATELQLSSRIDMQLMGRAARNGEPGSSQIFASIEDRLFLEQMPDGRHSLRRQADLNGEIAVTNQLNHHIAKMQRSAERNAMRGRKQLVKHDDC